MGKQRRHAGHGWPVPVAVVLALLGVFALNSDNFGTVRFGLLCFVGAVALALLAMRQKGERIMNEEKARGSDGAGREERPGD